nr:hypothetical protein [Georgfuchsia toluolica]
MFLTPKMGQELCRLTPNPPAHKGEQVASGTQRNVRPHKVRYLYSKLSGGFLIFVLHQKPVLLWLRGCKNISRFLRKEKQIRVIALDDL